jgi:hypothetical protein
MPRATRSIHVRIPVAAAVATTCFCALMPAAAAMTPTSREEINPKASGIQKVLAPNCPTGTIATKPVSVKPVAHRGVKYTFNIAGHAATEIVPPASFNPLTASRSELAEMNLPTRPSPDHGLGTWLREMASYKGFDTPALCQSKPLTRLHGSSPRAISPQAVDTHTSSYNWAGYINYGRTYGKVVAHWTQNSAHTCNCSGPTDESTWVGLGGVNYPRLIQAGTDMYSSNTPRAWWEYVGPNGSGVAEQVAGTVRVGDDIAAAVNWNTSHTVATFGLTDNGTYLFNLSISLPSYYDGSTAEYINERPAVCSGNSCHYPTLTNFVRTNFTLARAYLDGSATANAFTSLPYESVVASSNGAFYSPPCGTSSTLLMYPENPSGENFDTVWCRAQ